MIFSRTVLIVCCISASFFDTSCSGPAEKAGPVPAGADSLHAYAADVAFLKAHTTGVIELSSRDGQSRILLSAQFQGRVMTSTASGLSTPGFGWINYALIGARNKKKQFNPVGGEERWWLGPEGGQYGLYFSPGDPFDISHWQVPAFLDTLPWQVLQADSGGATFACNARFTNYSGTRFSVNAERTVRLLSRNDLQQLLGTALPESIKFTGFTSVNRLTNTGDSAWQPRKGLLSQWLLGMFTPGPETYVIIPFHPVPGSAKLINNNYFGPIPADRLRMTDSALFFSCDGKLRSKIGISPLIAKPVAGAFDFRKNILTILLPEVSPQAPYVNSKWEKQQEPYHGDVINAYNDGPLPNGDQMGPFFELESSSPAMALDKSAQGVYRQTTCHFQGDYETLRGLAKQLLGVDLNAVKLNKKTKS